MSSSQTGFEQEKTIYNLCLPAVTNMVTPAMACGNSGPIQHLCTLRVQLLDGVEPIAHCECDTIVFVHAICLI